MNFFSQKNIALFIALFCVVTFTVKAQQADSTKTDSLNVNKKLPFAIAKEKRLPDDELKEKKEGVYVTGVPDLVQIPLTALVLVPRARCFLTAKNPILFLSTLLIVPN